MSLLFALMAMVVLSLAAVALVRSVDTGALVIGNLGFKQDALAAGSIGTEAAITWLQANAGTALDIDNQAKGYSSVAITALDAADGVAAAAVALRQCASATTARSLRRAARAAANGGAAAAGAAAARCGTTTAFALRWRGTAATTLWQRGPGAGSACRGSCVRSCGSGSSR